MLIGSQFKLSQMNSDFTVKVNNTPLERVIGSFSIDDGNGSENDSFKMNSRFFNLCRVYSNLLKMASVGEFPRSSFLEDRTQV